jgi:hypothetical protein
VTGLARPASALLLWWCRQAKAGMFGAYVDERLAVLDGWMDALAGSEFDLSQGHLGAVFADQAGMVPVPTEIAIDDKLYKLQLRHGRFGMEGSRHPDCSTGPGPEGT